MFCCTPPLSPQTLPPPSITTTTIQKYIVCGFFVFNNHHNSSQKQNSSFVSFVFEGGVWSFRFSSVLVLTTDFHEIQNTTVFICCSNKKSKQNIQKPHNRQKSADVFPQQTKRDRERESTKSNWHVQFSIPMFSQFKIEMIMLELPTSLLKVLIQGETRVILKGEYCV